MKKTAIVSGGTSGIGVGVSHALARDGWQVIAAGVSQSEIDAFDARDNIELRMLDVADPDSVEALFSGLFGLERRCCAIDQGFGRLVGRRWHSRQCRCSRLNRNGNDARYKGDS